MFSERFSKLIDKKGISRYRISQDTKITEATLSNYCNGKVTPSPSIVKQLSEYLDVSFEWLSFGEGDEGMKKSVTGETKAKYHTKKKCSDVEIVVAYFEKEIERKNEQIARLTSIIENKLENALSENKKKNSI